LSPEESGWGGGRNAYVWANVDLQQNRFPEVLIRFGEGNILAGEVYATYETAPSSGLGVTYGWREDGNPREHLHFIAPETLKDSWTIPTGKDVSNQWVRFEAE
jgi:hypothetical protein